MRDRFQAYNLNYFNSPEYLQWYEPFSALERASHRSYEEFAAYVAAQDPNQIARLMRFTGMYGSNIVHHLCVMCEDLRKVALCLKHGASGLYRAPFYHQPGYRDMGTVEQYKKNCSVPIHSAPPGYWEDFSILVNQGVDAYERKKTAEENAKRQAQEAVRRQAEEAQRRQQELAQQQAEARRRQAEEAKRRAEEEANRQAERARLALEATRLAEEAKTLQLQQEEARKRQAEEMQRQLVLQLAEEARITKLAKIMANVQLVEELQIAFQVISAASEFFDQWFIYANEQPTSHRDAVGKGVSLIAFDIASLVTAPMDNLFYPVTELLYDAVVIAAHRNILESPHPDIVYLRTQIDENPDWYAGAADRMRARGKAIEDIIDHYLHKAEPEEYTREITRIIAPGFSLKGASAIIQAHRNLKTIGQISAPKFQLKEMTTGGLKKVEKLSPQEVRGYGRENAGVLHSDPLMYVIKENGELVITRPMNSSRRWYDHWDLGEGKPVRAAGDLYVNAAGEIAEITNRSGSYAPSSTAFFNLERYTEEVVQKSFPEAKGKYRDWRSRGAADAPLEFGKMDRPNIKRNDGPLLTGVAVGALSVLTSNQPTENKIDSQKTAEQQRATSEKKGQSQAESRNKQRARKKPTENHFPQSSFYKPYQENPYLAYDQKLWALRKPMLWIYPQVMQWIGELTQKANNMPTYLSSPLGFYTYPEHLQQILLELTKEVQYLVQTKAKTTFSSADLAQLYHRAEQQANQKEIRAANKASPEEHARRKTTCQQAKKAHVASLQSAQKARKKDYFSTPRVGFRIATNRCFTRGKKHSSRNVYRSNTRCQSPHSIAFPSSQRRSTYASGSSFGMVVAGVYSKSSRYTHDFSSSQRRRPRHSSSYGFFANPKSKVTSSGKYTRPDFPSSQRRSRHSYGLFTNHGSRVIPTSRYNASSRPWLEGTVSYRSDGNVAKTANCVISPI